MAMGDLRPTERFSDRVEAYVKYRPGYPTQIIDLFRKELGLVSGFSVADVGSGTGIFSKLLLDAGCAVIGIEPNAPMREASHEFLASYPRFRSLPGTAESTGLADASVDLVTCAQAFHWFDPWKASAEFRRIRKPGGGFALIWNERILGDRGFGDAYEALLHEFGTDYASVTRVGNEKVEKLDEYFKPEPVHRAKFPNEQLFDFEGLLGRIRSASYCPEEGTRQYSSMLTKLRKIFDQHAAQDRVRFEYESILYYGGGPG